MERPSVEKTILAGFAATLAITVLMYATPMLGWPRMDTAAMLGSIVTGIPPEPGSGAWWMGLLLHGVNGAIVFPLLFAYMLYGLLPGRPVVKGTLWGLTLWLLSQAVVAPMLGIGFFATATPSPALMVLGSFIGHCVYGAILGGTAARRPARIPRAERRRRPERERRAA